MPDYFDHLIDGVLASVTAGISVVRRVDQSGS